MTRRRRGTWPGFILGLLPALAAGAQETPVPELTGRVVDEAGMLAATEREAIAGRLARLEAATTVQLVVVTVPRIEGAIEDFSLRVAEAWGIGRADDDSGLLLVISRDDRQARIETGYGLEGAIPDGLAGRIIRERLAPRFAANDYAGGVLDTVDALALAATGDYPAAATGTTGQGAGRGRSGRRGFALWAFGALILFQLLGYVGNAFHPAGAAALGLGLAALAALLFLGISALWWLAPVGAVAGLGSTALTRARAASGGGGWGYGGGGMFIGPGLRTGGFGGFGGGGFSGGGGGFGGGGASGSW